MERDFWLERWENNQIGFHQDEFSPYLIDHWAVLGAKTGCQVFVPMAGKTKDMLWLANEKHKVLGIELSEIAVDAFFKENNLKADKSDIGKHIQYQTDDINFLCGDFFELTADDTRDVKAVFDRASMIAMPPQLRKKYADHMAKLLVSGTEILLVSMEYAGGTMSGPPFSVDEESIRALYSDHFTIQLRETFDVLEQNAHFKDRGLTRMIEKVYQLTRR